MTKVTYLILTHQDERHLGRLVERLGDRVNVVVHVDAKRALRPFVEAVARPEVVFAEHRVDVRWGGWSMVEATKQVISEALRCGFDRESSHFVLLSGADYPLRPAATIHSFLTERSGHNFIRWIDVRDSPEFYLRSVSRRYLFDLIPVRKGWKGKLGAGARHLISAAFSLASKPLREDVTYAFGSQWWALTPQCARFATLPSEITRHATRILRTARAPDELYFHTIVANSNFCARADGRQRYEGRGTFRLANLHLIDPTLTRWYAESDFEEIRSASCFFVRKVSSAASTLLDRIDRELL